MTVITLATIGYGETRPLTDLGRVFTMALIVAGVSAGAYLASAVAELRFEERLRAVLGRKRLERKLAHLTDHYILCGWGRMGQEIGQQLRSKGVPMVVIEISEEKCRQLEELGILYVQGDAADDATLREAGVERARGLVAVAPKDADNIFIALSARSLNSNLFIVSRSVFEQDVHKLKIAGADRVISPYVIGARRIASAIFHPNVCDFLGLELDQDDMEWELEDVPVTGRSPFAGKTIRDSGIRRHTGCTILAVKNGESSRFQSNPDSDTPLRIGDTLVVIGTPDQLRSLETYAGIPKERRHARTVRPSTRRQGLP
jgi:voltage-gated potassium channel